MINLKLADAAIEASNEILDENDKRRLAFFRDIWNAQNNVEEGVKSAKVDSDNLKLALAEKKFYIENNPIEISRNAYISSLHEMVDAVCSSENAGDELKAALGNVDWDEAVASLEDADFALAGSNPAGFIETLAQSGEYSDEVLTIAVLALRPFLSVVAQALKDPYEGIGIKANHPLLCPVCGSRASVARVGKTKHSQGRGKELYCQTCGFTWEFERVRCAVCGTRDQLKLHYFNLEGDDVHRLATCDECGGYVRTVYQDEALSAFSFEVEDVVMAKLDTVAATFANKD
jgi:FdhE protein